MVIKDKQLEFLDWELGVFFHFGIRTFYEGHKDWDMKEMPLEAFNPVELDCKQWISTAKAGGARYAILVCKHHDGFANWPSAYTEYSVKNTPWKDGKGDVVKEFTDACREYGLKIGLYYSPAQFGSKLTSAKEYDDYFVNQISELLGNYGKIDYLWFDGCGSEGHVYDTVRIVSEIRRLQPEILIFNMWDPDVRWVGNESGIAPMPNHNVVNVLDFSVLTDDKVKLDEKVFLPAECDCRIRQDNWFYSDFDAETLKSVDELMGLYYYSVGRGANLLINIAPDRRGLLPEQDVQRFIEFGSEVNCIYSDKKAIFSDIKRDLLQSNTYYVEFDKNTCINHIVLEEKMTNAEQIEEFSIYAYPYPKGERILVYKGFTVGHKHICKFPSISTQRLEVVIEKEIATHEMKNIEALFVK